MPAQSGLLARLLPVPTVPLLALWMVRHRRRATALAVLAVTIALMALMSWLASPRNLAVGRPWQASSAGDGFPPAGRLEAAAAATAFMHTEEQERPSLLLDLEGVHTIGAFEIENRRDCCTERTVPLAIEISIDGTSWTLLGRRTAGFSTWVRHFEPVTARYVRLQVERRSILHLSRVGIYGR